ncbi:hypothetical protein [Pseudoxanthomonas sp. PXM01]|uniref:hypothetical protein n=1 Tax=Pseudoxanthomonas sp. PXM01 TaxID=2769295 RepID=UPI001781AB71|nr:hypothetical protein [Pseudoxanthomonas sp. PXM01]MBD9471160.1 hypothetical protein [Pseudoxanthomonas sp. PXM01]
MSRIRSARKPAGKGVFLFALLLLLAWLCAVPWILVDSDVPLTLPPLMLADPSPSQ